MQSPPSAQHRLRIGRHSLPGQIYLLTTVTHRRQPFFANAEVARLAARTSAAPESWQPSRCLCWVLMPDHWHGLIELADDADLSATMQRFKGTLSHRIGQCAERRGPLWMRGFHDHALRDEESLDAAARYIIANPVRAGLVDDVLDYPYWDAWFLDGNGELAGYRG